MQVAGMVLSALAGSGDRQAAFMSDQSLAGGAGSGGVGPTGGLQPNESVAPTTTSAPSGGLTTDAFSVGKPMPASGGPNFGDGAKPGLFSKESVKGFAAQGINSLVKTAGAGDKGVPQVDQSFMNQGSRPMFMEQTNPVAQNTIDPTTLLQMLMQQRSR